MSSNTFNPITFVERLWEYTLKSEEANWHSSFVFDAPLDEKMAWLFVNTMSYWISNKKLDKKIKIYMKKDKTTIIGYATLKGFDKIEWND